MYALIVNGTIIRAMIALPPELVTATVAEQEAAGYYAITGPARPDDDPTTGTYWEPTVTLVAGRPVVTWTRRPPMTSETARIVITINTQLALDLASWFSDIRDIKTFLADPDIQRVLDQPNNTPLTTSDINRALKSLVRQARRQANLAIRISKVVVGSEHPEALLVET